jgi:hypothetical protein
MALNSVVFFLFKRLEPQVHFSARAASEQAHIRLPSAFSAVKDLVGMTELQHYPNAAS